MTKTLIVAALLSSFAAVSFAQARPRAAAALPLPAKHAMPRSQEGEQGRFGCLEPASLGRQEGWQLSSLPASLAG